jgi:aspartokinase/homoserine dehydrogenase 1
MFNALGRAGINIRAIAQGSSEKNISVVVKEENLTSLLR